MGSSSFNLIDEKWILTVDKGAVSLRDAFSCKDIKQLGGTVIEKLSIFKLLLAIAQSAYTPKDDEDWKNYSAEKMTAKICSYLDKYHDRFFLYSDEHPFLQFPVLLNKSKLKAFSVVQPHIASGNTTLRTQSEVSYTIFPDEAARILVSQMNFAFGGKQVDNSVVLTPNYKGKSKSGKVGTGLSFFGYLHSYYWASNLIDSIRLNLLTSNDIKSLNIFPSGVGVAPWENMPSGEDDSIAKAYKQSLMGRLVSLGRFCLLEHDGLYLTEGLAYQDHRDGVCDPAVTTDNTKKDIKVIWANPEKKPWRSLPSILSFIGIENTKVMNLQMQLCKRRLQTYTKHFAIWASGQKVSSNSGEFKVSGRDDSVDSCIWIESGEIFNDKWYDQFANEINSIEKLAFYLQKSIEGYLADLEKNKEEAKKYIFAFWENVDSFSQQLSDYCCDFEQSKLLRHTFAQIAKRCYDEACPSYTSRQLKAWADHQIFTAKYEHEGEI